MDSKNFSCVSVLILENARAQYLEGEGAQSFVRTSRIAAQARVEAKIQFYLVIKYLALLTSRVSCFRCFLISLIEFSSLISFLVMVFSSSSLAFLTSLSFSVDAGLFKAPPRQKMEKISHFHDFSIDNFYMTQMH